MSLIDNIPAFYNNDYTKPILDSLDVEIEKLKQAKKDVQKQFFIDTATWGIVYWEDMLGIKRNESLPLQVRRENCKAKRRSVKTSTILNIKNICESYSKGEVDIVIDKENQSFEIVFVGSIGIPQGFDEMDKIIEKIKPCHLGHTYTFRYNTQEQLEQYTHEQLEPYTHNDLRNLKF